MHLVNYRAAGATLSGAAAKDETRVGKPGLHENAVSNLKDQNQHGRARIFAAALVSELNVALTKQ